MPPRANVNEHAAVDEARALKPAYERSIRSDGNRIGASREITNEQVPEAIAAFVRIAEGHPWKEAGIPGNPSRVALDIRGYYLTAALELADHTPGAWAGEDWFYNATETGALMKAARTALKASGAPQPLWFYLAPLDIPA